VLKVLKDSMQPSTPRPGYQPTLASHHQRQHFQHWGSIVL